MKNTRGLKDASGKKLIGGQDTCQGRMQPTSSIIRLLKYLLDKAGAEEIKNNETVLKHTEKKTKTFSKVRLSQAKPSPLWVIVIVLV